MMDLKAGLQIEEYKHLSDAILKLEGRINKIFLSFLAISFTVITFILKFLSTANELQQDQFLPLPLLLAWIVIISSFMVVLLFYYLIALRKEIAKIGMYRYVFFEDIIDHGWERRLEKFRLNLSGETLDVIANPFSLILLIFATIQFFIVHRITTISICEQWCLILLPIGCLLFHYFYMKPRWNNIIKYNLITLKEQWKAIQKNEKTEQ